MDNKMTAEQALERFRQDLLPDPHDERDIDASWIRRRWEKYEPVIRQALSAPRVPAGQRLVPVELLEEYIELLDGVQYKPLHAFVRKEAAQAIIDADSATLTASPEPVAPRGRNEYGLDVSYFHDKLSQIVRDCQRYTPDEMARSLARLAVVADESVLAEKEFSKHATSQDQQLIADLRAEVERERKAKYEYVELYKAEQVVTKSLRAEVEALKAALRPLALLDLRGDNMLSRPDDQPVYARDNTVITVGDVRRAAARLREGGA